jgi:hypothetical protein
MLVTHTTWRRPPRQQLPPYASSSAAAAAATAAAAAAPSGTSAAAGGSDLAGGLTVEQQYEFDIRGFVVLRQHYDARVVAQLNCGIDELQRIPCEHSAYTHLGVASDGLSAAMTDPAVRNHTQDHFTAP